jgi:hypothetical protein
MADSSGSKQTDPSEARLLSVQTGNNHFMDKGDEQAQTKSIKNYLKPIPDDF